MKSSLLVLAVVACAAAASANNLVKVEKATALIVALDEHHELIGHGSGFFITSAGHIATNEHVVKDADSLMVLGGQLPNRGLPAKVIWSDEELDLAVLEVISASKGFVPLSLFSKTAGQAIDVYAFGYPGTQIEYMSDWSLKDAAEIGPPTVSKGIISRNYQSQSIGRLIQHSADIRMGNSGGPLVNLCGHVVGINVALNLIDPEDGGGKDNFAVSSTELIDSVGSRISGMVFSHQCDNGTKGEYSPVDTLVAYPSTTPAGTDSQTQLFAFALLISLAVITINVQRSRRKYAHFGRSEDDTNLLSPVSTTPSTLLKLSGFDQLGTPFSLSINDGGVLEERGYILGRSSSFSDLAINHQRLSRAHLWITRERGIILATDLNSTNGTFLNGRKLSAFENAVIAPGDEIRLADIILAVSK